jgi:hypothetical protein
MPLGQCIADMAPEGRRPVLDDFGVPIVHVGDGFLQMPLRLTEFVQRR